MDTTPTRTADEKTATYRALYGDGPMHVHVTARMDLELGRGRNKEKILILTGLDDAGNKVAVHITPDTRSAALKALRGFQGGPGSGHFEFEAESVECPVPLLAGTYEGHWYTARTVKRLKVTVLRMVALRSVDIGGLAYVGLDGGTETAVYIPKRLTFTPIEDEPAP